MVGEVDKDQREARKDCDGLVNDDANNFTGCTEATLWHMVDVRSSPLLEGHTFPFKDTLMIRIAEEANLYGVHFKTICSDGFQVLMKPCIRSLWNMAWSMEGPQMLYLQQQGELCSGRRWFQCQGKEGPGRIAWRT